MTAEEDRSDRDSQGESCIYRLNVHARSHLTQLFATRLNERLGTDKFSAHSARDSVGPSTAGGFLRVRGSMI